MEEPDETDIRNAQLKQELRQNAAKIEQLAAAIRDKHIKIEERNAKRAAQSAGREREAKTAEGAKRGRKNEAQRRHENEKRAFFTRGSLHSGCKAQTTSSRE